MADKNKQQPTAQATLILGKTFRTARKTFINGRPQTVVGESNIRYFETDSRFVVRRSEAIREEVIAARKKATPKKPKKGAKKATPKKPKKGAKKATPKKGDE